MIYGEIHSVEVKQYITVKFYRGVGVSDDVHRIVTSIFDMDGNLISESDPVPTTKEQVPYHKLLEEQKRINNLLKFIVSERPIKSDVD